MKMLYLALCTIILTTLVSDVNCGVINDVYGNVKNKTEAIKDGVSSWLSYGKEILIGSKGRSITQGKNLEITDEGIFSSIYNRLLNGLLSARDNVYSLFAFDDAKVNTETISSVPDAVKHRIALISSLDENSDKPIKAMDLTEIRRAINTMINKQKEVQEQLLNNKIKPIKVTVEDTSANLNKEIDIARESAIGVGSSAVKIASDGIESATELLNKGINRAKELSSTLEHLQQSGIELSEMEKEVLNAISNRIRDRANGIYPYENATEGQKKPSQVAEENIEE